MNPLWERKLVPVDSLTHRNTRVLARNGRQYGDGVHLVGVVPSEFPALLAHYPLFFAKDTETGQFGLAAMLGFDGDENLFLDGEEWVVPYVPLHAQRGPFSVGPDAAATQLVPYIDVNDPRVSEHEGESLFTDAGEPTGFLQRINAVLQELIQGTNQVALMVDAMEEHDLLEPLALQFDFVDNHSVRLDGLYTVQAEKLTALRGDALQDLHEQGCIKLMHEVLASVTHVSSLVGMKNRRIQASSNWASI